MGSKNSSYPAALYSDVTKKKKEKKKLKTAVCLHTDAVVPFKRQDEKAIRLIRTCGLRGRLICGAM